MRRASPDQRNHSYNNQGETCTPAATQPCAMSRGVVPISIDSSADSAASGIGRPSQWATPATPAPSRTRTSRVTVARTLRKRRVKVDIEDWEP